MFCMQVLCFCEGAANLIVTTKPPTLVSEILLGKLSIVHVVDLLVSHNWENIKALINRAGGLYGRNLTEVAPARVANHSTEFSLL